MRDACVQDGNMVAYDLASLVQAPLTQGSFLFDCDAQQKGLSESCTYKDPPPKEGIICQSVIPVSSFIVPVM